MTHLSSTSFSFPSLASHVDAGPHPSTPLRSHGHLGLCNSLHAHHWCPLPLLHFISLVIPTLSLPPPPHPLQSTHCSPSQSRPHYLCPPPLLSVPPMLPWSHPFFFTFCKLSFLCVTILLPHPHLRMQGACAQTPSQSCGHCSLHCSPHGHHLHRPAPLPLPNCSPHPGHPFNPMSFDAFASTQIHSHNSMSSHLDKNDLLHHFFPLSLPHPQLSACSVELPTPCWAGGLLSLCSFLCIPPSQTPWHPFSSHRTHSSLYPPISTPPLHVCMPLLPHTWPLPLQDPNAPSLAAVLVQ
jgi:hypothetical protein